MDPIAASNSLEKIVTRQGLKGQLRKYYRFRPARFYGGIATADAVGCNLNCAFCWVNRPRKKPGEYGRDYSARQVAEKLEKIARRKGFNKVRISGAEPTIGREHLLEVVDRVDDRLLFILETNGILLGKDESYAVELTKENLHVRVALKGSTGEEFSVLTGAEPKFFDYQLKALENLKRTGASCHAAVMSFMDVDPLVRKLQGIDEGLADNLEIESMLAFPHTEREMTRRRIRERLVI